MMQVNNNSNRPSAFSNMNNKPKTSPWSNPTADYRTWKNQEDEPGKKEVNLSSFTDFPDLVKGAEKKSVFEGSSLADRLKEVIAAEEHEAIQRRLKKGETPESLLRDSCTILPYKREAYKPRITEALIAPYWVTDISNPILIPPIKCKSFEDMKKERLYRRYNIYPNSTMLIDHEDTEEIEDIDDSISDTVSLPPSDEE